MLYLLNIEGIIRVRRNSTSGERGSSDSDPFFPEQYVFSANKSSGQMKKSHSRAIVNQMGECLITK